jgi:hypothetical protein
MTCFYARDTQSSLPKIHYPGYLWAIWGGQICYALKFVHVTAEDDVGKNKLLK